MENEKSSVKYFGGLITTVLVFIVLVVFGSLFCKSFGLAPDETLLTCGIKFATTPPITAITIYLVTFLIGIFLTKGILKLKSIFFNP